MAHIFWTIVNQISITVPQANVVIGAIVVIIAASGFKGVWDTISGKN